MPEFTGGKQKWYTDVFEFPWPDVATKASLVKDDIGRISEKKVHLTLFRPAWTYQFQRENDTDTIVDRIFGRGTGGVHVTLELDGYDDPDPVKQKAAAIHCYRDGPNYGRTTEERAALQKLLDDALAGFVEKIDEQKTTYTKFVWTDCDDTDEPLDFLAVNPRVDVFERIAGLATIRHEITVVYPAQTDSALMWSTGSVHPLQALQNSHQRLVRDAIRGLDNDAAMLAESEELGKFYYFTAAPPKLLGLAKDAPADYTGQLEELESTLQKLERELPTLPTDKAAEHLEKVHDALWKLRQAFDAGTSIEERKQSRVYPPLLGAERQMTDFETALGKAKLSAKAAADLEMIRDRLARAHRELTIAHAGMCTIQNFHTIAPFYLFRLLVKFQIQSDKEIPAGKRTDVSRTLTSLMHNSPHLDWLFDWLRDKLVELDDALAKACPDRGPASDAWPDGEPAVVFFLKGGRAAKYLQGLAKKGENDWDTNIVINPNLSASDWYRTFLLVHNTILNFLQKAKREFALLVHQSAPYGNMLTALNEAEKPDRDKRRKEAENLKAATELNVLALAHDAELPPNFWESAVEADIQLDALERGEYLRAHEAGSALEMLETEGCKAELIDIGIPRRDTVEAFEQWFNVCPKIIRCPDKIPIPGHLYYVAEYVTMIREAFMDKCISLPKTPTRVIRLLEVLDMDSDKFDEYIDEEKHHIPTSLKASVDEVEKLAKPLKRMLTILLKQFAEAYELGEDPDLARMFDERFATELPSRATHAKYPDSLNKAIAKHETYADDPGNKALADAVGFAQWLAELVGKHLQEARAKFMLEQLLWLEHFVKAIYTASFFSHGEDLEVQFAVTGALAARYHARYANFERMEELEPVKRLDLTLFCKPGSDPATVLELIRPLIDTYLSSQVPNRPNYVVTDGGTGRLFLQWPEQVKFDDDLEYKPMAIKIAVEVVTDGWPQLAFVRGLPVLGLRDLIWAYKRRTGHVEETFTQRSLRTAIDAMVDILTRFENPGPAKPWTPSVEQVAPVAGPMDGPGGDGPVVVPPAVVAPPLVVKEVAGLEFIPQPKANWCWAASSLMMRRFYLDDQSSVEDVVREMFSGLDDAQSSLRLSRLKPEGSVEGRLLTWEAIKGHIDGNRPFILARRHHYLVCYGYEEGAGGVQRLLYWDPLPRGVGKQTKMSYAEYQSFIQQGGGTAQAFEIKPQQVLLPLRLHDDSLKRGATHTVFVANATGLPVATCEVLVRLARNSRGELGAVIVRQQHRGLPARFEWDMNVPSEHWPDATTRMQVAIQVEATLRVGKNRAAPGGTTTLNVGVEKPSG